MFQYFMIGLVQKSYPALTPSTYLVDFVEGLTSLSLIQPCTDKQPRFET